MIVIFGLENYLEFINLYGNNYDKYKPYKVFLLPIYIINKQIHVYKSKI